MKILRKYKKLTAKVPKVFFSDSHEESCFTLNYYIELIQEGMYEEIILDGAQIVKGEDEPFWCNEVHEPAESTIGCCGNICEWYDPRNGKSGRCKQHRNCYEYSGRKFKLTCEPDLKNKIQRFILTEITND